MKEEIPLSIVTELIKEQFPQWAHLEIKPVELSGWDNRTFRLGLDMSIRLPSAERYAAKVQKEQQWLPFLAKHLSFDIPEPIAMGSPSKHFPYHWSIYRWIEGKSANELNVDELCLEDIALKLAQFLNELHKIDITDGDLPGPHNFYRGGSLMFYDAETRSLIELLKNYINVELAVSVWTKAISSQWNKNPVWIHGDLSAGNILIKDKQLVAVIDFGGMGIGDPACDLVISWTLLKNESREIFKTQVNLDDDTWARARGWALWKALFTLNSLEEKTSLEGLEQKRIFEEVIFEHGLKNCC